MDCSLLWSRARTEPDSPLEKNGRSPCGACTAWRNGVPAELITRDYEVQCRMWYATLRGSSFSHGHIDDMRALHPAMTSRVVEGRPLVTRALQFASHSFCRSTYGDWLCDTAGIPDTWGKHITRALPTVFRLIEAVRRNVGVVDRAWTMATEKIIADLVPLLFDRNDQHDHYAKPAT